MTSLATAILLTLTVLGAVGCDSNPVPHPGQESADRGNDAYTPGVITGGADASTPPGRNDDDQDPTGDGNFNGGAAESPCDPEADNKTDAEVTDEADVIDGDAGPQDDASDDNATDASDGDGDCGPSEVQPPPAGAADQDQVEE